MQIAQSIFARKRPILSHLKAFGFQKTEDHFVFKRDFMNGDFTAIVTITKDGALNAKAWDNMNDEEYTQVDASGIVGGYVGDVRLEYERILQDVADNCFEDVLFAHDQSNRITAMITQEFDVSPDFPWDDAKFKPYGVFRHKDTGKWFALIMNIKAKHLFPTSDDNREIDVINLKRAPHFAEPYPAGVFPSYHMNKRLWISVVLDDTLNDKHILSLIKDSFIATNKK